MMDEAKRVPADRDWKGVQMTEQDFINRFTALLNHAGPIISKIAAAPVETLDNATVAADAEYATGVRRVIEASKSWLAVMDEWADRFGLRNAIADAIAKEGT